MREYNAFIKSCCRQNIVEVAVTTSEEKTRKRRTRRRGDALVRQSATAGLHFPLLNTL